MTDHTDIPDDSIHDGQGTYDVVLLVEQALTPADAKQVRSLHSEIEDPVVYHVLLPLEDAAARIEASLGTLGAGDLMAAPALAMNDVDIEALRRECEEHSSSDLQQTLIALRDAGGTAHGKVTSAGRRAGRARHLGRRPRGHHPDRLPRGGGVLPRRLDLARPPQARRPGPPPDRARELRRAGVRLRRGRHRRLNPALSGA
jgi:hypothetical protein